MDLFERIFGLSPDGGDGSLELLYLLSIATAIMLIVSVYALSHCRKRASAQALVCRTTREVHSGSSALRSLTRPHRGLRV
jgi:hypothetical protein